MNDIVGIDSPPDVNIGSIHWSFSGNNPVPWYYLGLVLVLFSVVVIASLQRSRLGRAWEAIREDEVAAAHMGINITRTRLLAFGLGAAFSGFGGVIEASKLGTADATQFGLNISITILVMVILGGMGSILVFNLYIIHFICDKRLIVDFWYCPGQFYRRARI